MVVAAAAQRDKVLSPRDEAMDGTDCSSAAAERWYVLLTFVLHSFDHRWYFVDMSFDLEEIKDQASAALKGSNVEEARGVYMAAIMDVGDCIASMDDIENEDARKDVISHAVRLWISYAEMEISLRQWKKALAVYEEAIADQFVCMSGLIYKSYSNYCRDRNRPKNAEKILMKGLTHGLRDQKDVDMLWRELLMLTSSSLSMEELYEAIRAELGETASELSKPTDGLTLEEAMDDSMGSVIDV